MRALQFSLLLVQLILVGCQDKDQSFGAAISESAGSKLVGSLSRDTKEQLQEIKNFALKYYEDRTTLWAQYLFDMMKENALGKYLSETAELLGERGTRSIFVLDNRFEVVEVKFRPDADTGYDKDGVTIKSDLYWVKINSPIVGKIVDDSFVKKPKEHVPAMIAVIVTAQGLKIWSDTDIKWYETSSGESLADVYVFEKDVSKVLGKVR